MRMMGLSEFIGSWKIIEMSLPRTDCISPSERPKTSVPSKLTSPVTRLESLSSRRMTESDVTDLPQPDSPTRPTISPAFTVNEMPFTAVIHDFLSRLNSVLRFFTSSSVFAMGTP